MDEIPQGTITLRAAFYRYYGRRFGEPYIHHSERALADTAEQAIGRDELIKQTNVRDNTATAELRQAFKRGELIAETCRDPASRSGWTVLHDGGWYNHFTLALFVGAPLGDNPWPNVEGLTPFVRERKFQIWMAKRFPGVLSATPDKNDNEQGSLLPARTSSRRAGTATKPRRGKSRQYAWDEFLAEALEKLEMEGGISPVLADGFNKTAMYKYMYAWCERVWKKVPGRTSIHDKIAEAEGFYKARKSA